MIMAPGTFAGLAGPEEDLMRRSLHGVGGIGVEIGCCDGYSTQVILEASNFFPLVSIDPLIPDSMEASLCGNLERLKFNTERFGDRFAHLMMTSEYAHKMMFTDEISFLFIDGDHSMEACRLDFNLWTPKLKKGGILAMHDCRMGKTGSPNFHIGPSAVAQDHVYAKGEQWQIIGEAFSLMLARKL